MKAKAIQEIFSFALILFTALMMALLVFQRRILVQWGVDPVLGERRDEIRARPRSSSREPFALSRSSNEQAMELSSLWRFNRIDVSDLPCPAAFSASHVYSSSSSSNERGGADRNTKTSTTTTKTCVNKRTDDGHERSQNKLSSYLSSLTGHGHGRHLKGSRETDAHVKTHQGTQGKSRGTFRSNTFHFSKSRKTSSSLHDLESILNLSSTPRPKDYLLLGAHRLSQSKGHFQNKRPRYPGRKRYVRQDRSRSTPHNIAITGHTQLQPQEHVKTPVNTTNTKSMDADTDANAESAHTNSAAHSSNLVDLSDNDTNTCLLPSPTGAPVLVNLNVTENHDEHNSQ